MSNANSVVAVFETHDQAEEAIRDLQQAGYNMKKLSIVGKDYHTEEHVVGYYSTCDRMSYWGKMGALWGGFWGMLFGSAFFWIPGIGPVLTGGIIGSIVMGMVEGAAVGAAVGGGASVLAASLASIGIPKDSVILYESALKAHKFLLVASGAAAEVDRARAILGEYGGQVKVHAAAAA